MKDLRHKPRKPRPASQTLDIILAIAALVLLFFLNYINLGT